jgi:hypothetical protein
MLPFQVVVMLCVSIFFKYYAIEQNLQLMLNIFGIHNAILRANNNNKKPFLFFLKKIKYKENIKLITATKKVIVIK